MKVLLLLALVLPSLVRPARASESDLATVYEHARLALDAWRVPADTFTGFNIAYCQPHPKLIGFCLEGNGFLAWARIGPDEQGRCVVRVSRALVESPPVQQQIFMSHEIGHCLGIPGDGKAFFGYVKPSLMNGSLSVREPNEWDFLMLRYYHGAPHRMVIADVTR